MTGSLPAPSPADQPLVPGPSSATYADTARPVAAGSSPLSAAGDLQTVVATSADAADLFASAPALLLELQTAAGELAAAATALTGRGRRPFRPDAAWASRLGDLAYRVFLLADQTGVPLDGQVRAVADEVLRAAQQRQAQRPPDDDDWPVRGG